jgi:hypothetical protein
MLVGEPERKRPLRRPKLRVEIILKLILGKEVRRVWFGFIWLL